MINRYTDMMMERDSLSNDYWEEDSLSNASGSRRVWATTSGSRTVWATTSGTRTIWATTIWNETALAWVDTCAPEGVAVPVPLVTDVVLPWHDTNIILYGGCVEHQ